MAASFQCAPNDLREVLQRFDERLRLARASELALLNHLQRAEEVLCVGGISNASASELDLLARIHVRQGRFDDARKRWQQAIARDDGSRAKFEECLHELEIFSVKQMKRRQFEWWFSLALLSVSILMGLWILVQLTQQNS